MRYSLTALPVELAEPTRTALTFLGHECAPDGVTLLAEQTPGGLRVRHTPEGIQVQYERRSQWFRALTLLDGDTEQSPCFENLCYMADCSRNGVLTVPAAKKLILCLALMGYDSLMLYTEDTYTIPEYPYFGYLRGRYSEEELRALDGYAAAFGLELIPCIQTLAHLRTTLRWSAQRLLRDDDNILLVDDEAVYTLIDRMLATVTRCFRSKKINVGMDEAFNLGLGRHLKKHGYEPRSTIMLRHVERVSKLCEKYGLAPMMWSDMFYRLAFGVSSHFGGTADPEIIKLVPENMTLIHWDYYCTDAAEFGQALDKHLQFPSPIAFAGGAWKWYGYAPNSTFSYRVSRAQLGELKKRPAISTVIVTGWGDNGAEASQFSVLPTLSLFAESDYGCEERLSERFAACFGRGLEDFFLLDLPDQTPDLWDESKAYDPSRYLLYNDPMAGIFDCHTLPSYDAFYAQSAQTLAARTEGPFGYLFETLGALCDLLSTKATLGVRLRNAYLAGERGTLADLAAEIREKTLPALARFHRALLYQWEQENKPQGFEVLDLRLGGLRQRLETTAEQVEQYAMGQRDALPQLEEARLPYAEAPAGQVTIRENNWNLIASAAPI